MEMNHKKELVALVKLGEEYFQGNIRVTTGDMTKKIREIREKLDEDIDTDTRQS